MTSQQTGAALVGSAAINARIDRLPRWGLSRWVLVALGAAYFFAYFDITTMSVNLPSVETDLNVSLTATSLPITLNLVGYMVGAFALGSLADYLGRRRALLGCVLILTVGAVLTAFSWNLASLTAFRMITGIGVGAQIAVASTWIGELSPAASRGRNLGLAAILGGFGFLIPALLAIPFAHLGPAGWRLLFGLGALVVVVVPFLNGRLVPESPRWLALHGQQDAADRIVAGMERRCREITGQDILPPPDVPADEAPGAFPTLDLLRSYPLRLAMVFLWFFVVYMFAYSYLTYEPTLLGKLGISAPNGVLYTAIALGGFPIGAIIQSALADKVERKYLIGTGLAVQLIGVLLIATSHAAPTIVIGGFLFSLGDFPAVITGYSYAAEIFPTRARASAMSLCDGLGHLGGALQPFIVVAILAGSGPHAVFWFMVATCAAALLFIQAIARRTTGRSLTELAR